MVFPREESAEELSRKIQYNVGRFPLEVHCGPRGSTEAPVKISALRVAAISALEEFILHASIYNVNLI